LTLDSIESPFKNQDILFKRKGIVESEQAITRKKCQTSKWHVMSSAVAKTHSIDGSKNSMAQAFNGVRYHGSQRNSRVKGSKQVPTQKF
jgi:hypothetical protein